MGKKQNLKGEVKKKIRELYQLHNHSYAQIADKVGVSKSSVQRVINSSPYRTNVKKGRKEILGERHRRSLARYMDANPNSTLKKALNELKFQCSAQTIRRNLIRREFANKKIKKEKGISKKNQEKRLNFARDHAMWTHEWQHVVFTDEKKWNLVGPDGMQHIWARKNRNINMTLITRANTSIMVWGAISASGPLSLILMNGKYDSKRYCEMLHTSFFHHADSLSPANSIFQQDNAPIRVSGYTLKYLKTQEINVLPWPPQSPDLSPIENVWASLTKRVYANGRMYNNKKELWTSIKEEWDKLTAGDMASHYIGMHTRMLDVIQSGYKKIQH